MFGLFRLFYSILLFCTIVDPGNTILNLKEIVFIFTFISGIVILKKRSFYYPVFTIVFFVGLLLPFYGLTLGLVSDQNFSFDYGIMYVKSFIFIFLLLVSCWDNFDVGKLFSKMTLLIIPITISIWYIVGEYNPIADYFFMQKEAATISRRAYGPLLIDPVVFYKTSPLLVFGIAYLCQKIKFNFSLINFVLIILGLSAVFISATRANMISAFIIFIYFLWMKIKVNRFYRILFLCFGILLILFLFPYLFNEILFNSEESSLNTKESLILSYVHFWGNNPLSFLFGDGLGAGLLTEARGLIYIIEPTYLELIRFWGILLFPVIFLVFLLSPIYYFYIHRKSNLFEKYKYILIAYLTYVFIEIPSNPLLLSSTGMIVFVITFATAFRIHLAENHITNS